VLAVSAIAFRPPQSPESVKHERRSVRTGLDSVGCLDTLRATDTITAVATLRVRRYQNKADLPAEFAGFFAQEFKSRFRVPSNLALSVVMLTRATCTTDRNCSGAGLWLSANAYAVARKDGSLSFIGVSDESLTPDFAESVRVVLETMSRDRAIPEIYEDSLPLEITIRPHLDPDTVPRERHLFRVRIPWYDLRLTPPDAPPNQVLTYPVLAERVGLEDSVAMSFTVLSNGSVHPGSLDVRSGFFREFIQKVATELEKSTYTPAQLGACPVATWTNQSFVFRMPRR